MKMLSIKKEGVVLETLPNVQFRIQLEEGKIIRAYLCGKMNQNRIKVLAGDRVILEIPPSMEISNCVGRIIFRK